MPEASSGDLVRFRAAAQFRDRCVRAAVERYRWAGLRLEDARATFDAVEGSIRADERRRIAEALTPLLAEGRFIAEAAVTHGDGCDQAHAGCLAREVRGLIGGKTLEVPDGG